VKIRVDEIPEEGLELLFSGAEDVLSQALAAMETAAETEIDPRIRGRLSVTRAGTDTFVTGTVSSTVKMTCARCLIGFQRDTQAEINLVARVAGSESEYDATTEDPDASVVFFEGKELDVSEIVLQECLLEVPMQPLCRPDCPGLCPKCGEVKGSSSCTCPEETGHDPRWNALARIRENWEK
jgi:uncharacterized protein